MPRGTVRPRDALHLIEQILRADELTTVAVSPVAFSIKPHASPVLPTPIFPTRTNVLRLGDELQLCKPANPVCGSRQGWRANGNVSSVQRSGRLAMRPFQRALLLRLATARATVRDEVRVADVALVGGAQLFVMSFDPPNC